MPTEPTPSAPPDLPRRAPGPSDMIRSRAHICALLLAAGLGVPISAVAYLFLALVGQIQQVIFSALPQELLGGQVLRLPTTSAPESISG